MNAVLVEWPDTPVMYLSVADGSAEMAPAWDQLEQAVGSLRGRRFLGAFEAGRYWVCVQAREGDDAAALGLRSGVIPGGRYLRARLRGQPPAVYELLQPTYAALQEAARCDPTRPGIEYYRRHGEIDVLMPVRD